MQIRNEEGAFKQQEYETAIQNDYANKNLSGLGLKLVDEPAQKIDISANFKGSAGNQTICTIQF